MAILAAVVKEELLVELCHQRCPESQTLEFKRALPGLRDRDKSEFLKDVCAVANTDGGDIVYGIAEEEGKAKELAPIVGEPADAAKRRLGQVIDAGIDPRLVGLQIQPVPVSGGYALIVRVPASFNGPHRYIVNNVGRFVMRNGTHTAELTYGQLRAAFDRTATLAERARSFRADRLAAISIGRTWRQVKRGPICVVHLIPIAAMAGNRSVDIPSLYNAYTDFKHHDWTGVSRSTNLDGLVVHLRPAPGEEVMAYTQIFRSGALEAIRSGGLSDPNPEKYIPAVTVATFFRHEIETFLKGSRSLGFSGPAIAGVALLGVAEYGLAHTNFSRKAADRDNLCLPETWLDNFESVSNVDEVARPLLDMLWQAFDIDRCNLYDAQGRWTGR